MARKPDRQLAGCWAGRGATEQVTYRDANGKTRDGAHEARIQGPSCWLGSDTSKFRTLDKERAGTRLVRSSGLRLGE